MRILPTSLLLVMAGAINAQAPSFAWARGLPMDMTGSPTYDSPPFQIAADPAGGAVITGLLERTVNYGAQAYGTLQYVHYSTEGTVDLDRSMPGNAGGSQLRYTAGGDVYMTGTFLDTVQLDGQHELTTTDNFPHPFLAKLDGSGDVIWALDLNVAYGATGVAKGLAVNAAGDAFVGMHVPVGAWIVHYAGDGTVMDTIEQTTFDVSSIDVDPLGHVYVTGSCVPLSGADFGGVHYTPPSAGGGYNRYLVRCDLSAVPTFIQFTEDVICTDAMVRCHGINSVYWCGSIISPTSFGDFDLTGPSNGNTPDVFLAKLDSTGGYAWAIEGPTGQNTGIGIGKLSYLEVDTDGNTYVAGQERGTITWPDASTTTTVGAFDPIVVSYDPDGAFRWAKQGIGAGNYEGAHAISLGPDGSAYVVGLARTSCSFDAWDVTSGEITNFPFVAKIEGAISTGLDEAVARDGMGLFPVPASDRLLIEASSTIKDVTVQELCGRIVGRAAFNQAMASLEVGDLPAGIYLAQVRLADGRVAVRRFTKQ